jgi:hypothetical protein
MVAVPAHLHGGVGLGAARGFEGLPREHLAQKLLRSWRHGVGAEVQLMHSEVRVRANTKPKQKDGRGTRKANKNH